MPPKGVRVPRLSSVAGDGVEAAAWCSKLRPGLSVLVWYADGDVWHERLLLFPVRTNGQWAILSADDDRYTEYIDCSGDSCVRARHLDDAGLTPADLRGKCYRFKKRLSDSALGGRSLPQKLRRLRSWAVLS